MKKRYTLLVVLVLIFQTFSLWFLYVDAKDSDSSEYSICAWPSETMALYFDFQNEMRTVLLGSEVNERRFKVTLWTGWLFSQQVVTLSKDTALDLVLNSVWNRTSSLISTAATSAVLLGLSAVSVIQSNTEWLAILFRDRPIVRDYKTMLDIESSLFDVAYFRSKQINLTRPVDGNMVDQFNEVVKKYQDLWLLDKKATPLKGDVSMSHVIWDLVWMNAAMKHFIVYDAGALKTFYGCMNKSKDKNCNPPILKFSDEAKEKLQNDYRWTFGKCNKHFNSLISKTTKDSWKAWSQNVKDAMKRLKNVWVTGWDWPWGDDRWCDVSDYEKAQIRAYLWDNWTCDDLVNLQLNLPKKSNQSLRKQQNIDSDWWDTNDGGDGGKTTSEKRQEWFYIYWEWSEYNPEYSLQVHNDFLQIYTWIKTEYEQSQWNAQSSDLSNELVKIRWLIDQLDGVIDISVLLQKQLEQIENYQAN